MTEELTEGLSTPSVQLKYQVETDLDVAPNQRAGEQVSEANSSPETYLLNTTGGADETSVPDSLTSTPSAFRRLSVHFEDANFTDQKYYTGPN